MKKKILGDYVARCTDSKKEASLGFINIISEGRIMKCLGKRKTRKQQAMME